MTDVVLSDERRIEDGKIDIQGLGAHGHDGDMADPDFIHQVVYNIVDNAIKFTPAGWRYQLCRREARQHGGGPHREHRRRHRPRSPALC